MTDNTPNFLKTASEHRSLTGSCSARQPTFEPLGELHGEDHVGQLAVVVRLDRRVLLLAVEVLEVDGAASVCHTDQVYHPTGRAAL